MAVEASEKPAERGRGALAVVVVPVGGVLENKRFG